jgi:MurNAc alpha-1-phosphate uridylyltransferase
MTKQLEHAVILAAGLGTRLKWLTDKRPKALMQVAGEAAIGHVIRSLVAQGVSEIAVNAHHHADQLVEYLGDGSRFGCRITISREAELLDSGGGVKQALSKLPGNGLLAVCNCDVLADVDVHRLAALLPDGGCSIALVANPPHHPDGDFSLNGTDVSISDFDRFTFSGISVWDEQVFDSYPLGSAFSLVRPMRELIRQGLCSGLLHQGQWFDIGRPSDLMQANRIMGRG